MAREKAGFKGGNYGTVGYQFISFDLRDSDLITNLQIQRDRFPIVFLRTGPSGKVERVARAVAQRHSKPPSPRHTIVAFKNGCSNDCRLSNLYWATPAEVRGLGKVANRLKRMHSHR